MKDQIMAYSVDTKAFYTEKERQINFSMYKLRNFIKIIEEFEKYRMLLKDEDITLVEFYKKKIKLKYFKTIVGALSLPQIQEYSGLKELFKIISNDKNKTGKKKLKKKLNKNEVYVRCRKKLQEYNKQLKNEIKSMNQVRELNTDEKTTSLKPWNVVALFESYTTRTLSLETSKLTMDLLIVTVLHYDLLKQLIDKGFTYKEKLENGQVKIHKYRVFTASAGQIRKKKVMFIREDIYNKYIKTLMCGLTVEDINKSEQHGCNINKFLAYLALGNSATDEWADFDIDKAIVIDDFETKVNGIVDFVDNKSFEVTLTQMDVPVPHSDGCGWILPSESSKNFMVRLPWIKGLLTPVDYIRFCKEYNDENYKITDIYGKVWDLKEDNIKYIFSKSQFKMWRYYPNIEDKDGNVIEYGWDTYKNNFKKYNGHACKCNVEPDAKEFRKASFNYQMWQTLTDITDDEIKHYTDKVDKFITQAYTDKEKMLEILGADENNRNKNYFQQALSLYPELLKDYHVQDELSSIINSKKNEAKYGKFKINATYTFLIPDVFAWMQYCICGIENPDGLLDNNQVSCRYFKNYKELLVDRSPHLYREHAVRDNIINKETKKWFTTDGIYTSCHDLISKILQFDK